MKTSYVFMINVLMLVFTSIFYVPPMDSMSYEVEVLVSGIQKYEGNIRIAIYSPENDFLSDDDILDHKIIPVEDGEVRLKFRVEKAGKYAMALIHDENSNGKMDFNFVGYPKEPYAFSKNPGIWFRKPTFEECALVVKGDRSVEIKMK